MQYSTVLRIHSHKGDKVSFENLLMNNPTLSCFDNGQSFLFRKRKNHSEESNWLILSLKELLKLIKELNHDNSDCDGSVTENRMEQKETWEILMLLDIDISTPVIYWSSPALVTFVLQKIHGKNKASSVKDCSEIKNTEHLNFIKGLLSCNCFKVENENNLLWKLEVKDEEYSIKQCYLAFIGLFDDIPDENVIISINSKLNALLSQINCHDSKSPLYMWFLKEENILYPINSSNMNDHNAKELNKMFEKKQKFSRKYNLPSHWILLHFEIERLCLESKNQAFVYLDEVYNSIWKAKCGNSSTEELKLALHFFHQLGVLYYFENVPGMCEYIITDCCWLFEQFTYLLFNCKMEYGDFKAYNLFVYEGILNKSGINEIIFDDKIKLQNFIDLLVSLDLIVPLNRDEYIDFFVPSILPSYQSQNYVLSDFGKLQLDALLVSFSTGSMHPLVFRFLIAHILQKFPNKPKKWAPPLQSKKNKRHTFCNLITFPVGIDHFISISDEYFFLKIEVYKKLKSEDTRYLHNGVFKCLKNILQEVCKKLSLPFNKLTYGFICNNCDISETHMMVAQINDQPLEAFCCKTEGIKEITETQMIWFS